MFEVFDSVQIKPFRLNIRIINKKILLSESPHFLSDVTFQHSVRLITKPPKLTDFPALKMFKFLGLTR